MISTRLFPTIMIVLDVFAAVVYGLRGWHEWRKVVYWLDAAVLTFTVTY